jgi:hypothetical protein
MKHNSTENWEDSFNQIIRDGQKDGLTHTYLSQFARDQLFDGNALPLGGYLGWLLRHKQQIDPSILKTLVQYINGCPLTGQILTLKKDPKIKGRHVKHFSDIMNEDDTLFHALHSFYEGSGLDNYDAGIHAACEATGLSRTAITKNRITRPRIAKMKYARDNPNLGLDVVDYAMGSESPSKELVEKFFVHYPAARRSGHRYQIIASKVTMFPDDSFAHGTGVDMTTPDPKD